MNLLLRFSFLVALIFSAISCDKDDDPVISGSLAGTWKMTDLHADDGVSETTLGGQTLTINYTVKGADYNTFTTFTENPNEFSSTGSYTAITNIEGGDSDTTSVDAIPGTGTWSINGQTLTQTFAGETSDFEILELSDAKLRLRQNLDVTVSDSIFGFTIHDKATLFTTFEKQ